MNKDAEAEINSLLESCPDMYDAMRKAMEWAYRDSINECRVIANHDYEWAKMCDRASHEEALKSITKGNRCDDCAQAIEQRAKEE